MTIPGGVRAIAGKATGRFYFEAVHQYGTSPGSAIGVADATASEILGLGADTHGYGVYPSGAVYHSGLSVGSVTPFGLGDTVGLAVDVTSKLLWARVNAGVWNADPTADPGAGTGGISIANLVTVFPMCTVQALSPVPVPPTPVPPQTWQFLASDSTGTNLLAVAFEGFVWTSHDSGATWTKASSPPSAGWFGACSSSDGTKLAVCALNDLGVTGQIWTSADSGSTWTHRSAADGRDWSNIACSSDGDTLVAVTSTGTHTSPGEVWTSTNQGVSWTAQTGIPGSDLLCVVSSSDGATLLSAVGASDGGSGLWGSTNGGVSWAEQTIPQGPPVAWGAIASSSTGAALLAARQIVADVDTSANSGGAWTQQSGFGSPTGGWLGAASSSNGAKLLITGPDNIWTSTNSGAAWTQRLGAGVWGACASSADGSHLVIGNPGTGLIWLSTDSGANWTSVNPTP